MTPRKPLIIATLAALAVAAPAAAAEAPTVGPVKIIKAGQSSPIDVAGNNLHRGATIRKGTELRRWLVTMHGRSKAPITLRCAPGAVHVGLGMQEGAKLGIGVVDARPYGKRSIRVRAFPAPGVSADGAKASVYALCKTR